MIELIVAIAQLLRDIGLLVVGGTVLLVAVLLMIIGVHFQRKP